MRTIDADKIHPDCMTKDGKIAISQSQLANAPTVPLSDFKEGYKQAIIDGKTNFSRPQGEWIDEYWEDAYQAYFHICSVCKEEIEVLRTCCDNFCSTVVQI